MNLNKTLTEWLVRRLPRPFLVFAAEIGGFCPVQDPTGSWASRLRLLIRREPVSFHERLFDAGYYLNNNKDVRESHFNPLLHFLLWGGFEGRKPHPLFDPGWYLAEYGDVAERRLNPLQHYLQFGRPEGRHPHPLFDPAWYINNYPDIKAAGVDPLLHFIRFGGWEGRRPHPLFHSDWYLRRYPRVKALGVNPLVHYLEKGAGKGYRPNTHFNVRRYYKSFPSLAESGVNPLVHYVAGVERGSYDPHPGYPRRGLASVVRGVRPVLQLQPSGKLPAPRAWRNSHPSGAIDVFIVYGLPNVRFIESILIPALAAQNCRMPLRVHALNYSDSSGLLGASTVRFSGGSVAAVIDWSEKRTSGRLGFGEAVNYLFNRVCPADCFLLVNPDSLPMPGCLDRLLTSFCEGSAAFVEARQWPSEHPKEYEARTGWTPWASGAFMLASSEAFRRLNGFDPIYFLYNEDVDLSWRAWLGGMPVAYEPGALCAHFTGLLSYRPARFYNEHFFSLRNFLLIAYKFFGPKGENEAWRLIEAAAIPASFRQSVRESYLKARGAVACVDTVGSFYADKIKIVGLNLYHQVRQV
ncbi:MAG TPA: glycosyltransferase [Bryobacteraceae bacterium]